MFQENSLGSPPDPVRYNLNFDQTIPVFVALMSLEI